MSYINKFYDRLVQLVAFLVFKSGVVKSNHEIVYYPLFRSSSGLTNHYFRARWYLPFVQGKCESVALFCGGVKPKLSARPEHFCQDDAGDEHIHIQSGLLDHIRCLLRSRVVLVWKSDGKFIPLVLTALGKRVVNVDTEDVESVEYGTYCGLFWRYLLNKNEKESILFDNYQKLSKAATTIRDKDIEVACVFGTGPSIDEVFDFDFSNCLTIVCNSIVQNNELMDHLNPKFVCAGDVVSHFGVSRYAEIFRRDLAAYLKAHDSYFFTTAAFGYFFLLHFPDLEDKVIFAEQKNASPNFDLLKIFELPVLDSTLNIHMLPLAATFSNHIFIVGCDGKSPKKDENEDFWAHSRLAQYHDLVQTGHLAHPTFDIHRQQNTYDRYLASIATTLSLGEGHFNKHYMCLKPSYTPGLAERVLPKEVNGKGASPVLVKELPSDLWGQEDSVSTVQDKTHSLAIKSGISAPVIRDERFILKGWFLSQGEIEKIEVFADHRLLGYAMLTRRPDIFKKFPEYNNEYAGFIYCGKKSLLSAVSELKVMAFSGGEQIAVLQQKIRIKVF